MPKRHGPGLRQGRPAAPGSRSTRLAVFASFADTAIVHHETAQVAHTPQESGPSRSSPRKQVKRNADGWGLDPDALEAPGLVRVTAGYPEVASLEDHFIRIRRAIEEHKPSRLVIDTLPALDRVVSPRALLYSVIALGAVVRQQGITTLSI